MLLKRKPVRSSEEVTTGLSLLRNSLFNSYKKNVSPLDENTRCSLAERMCICTCRLLRVHAHRWVGRMQAMAHIWVLTSVILNPDVIRCSLVCCSQHRWVYFTKPAWVLLAGDPAGGNVSAHLSQSVTFKGAALWVAVNRLNIASLCHVFCGACRWPFVIAPSVLKSQRSITANGDRNRLFNQIISRALRVRLSALRCSPHQTPAAEGASPNAVTAVAIVRGHLKSS